MLNKCLTLVEPKKHMPKANIINVVGAVYFVKNTVFCKQILTI